MTNEILSLLVGYNVIDSSKVIEQGWMGSNQYNTGCLIKSTRVHSISDGTIIAVDKDPKTDTWSVTVEVSSQKWIRYCLLSATGTVPGMKVTADTVIGYGYKGKMRLEYCTSEKSEFPVRVLNHQLYKHDPTPILFSMEVI